MSGGGTASKQSASAGALPPAQRSPTHQAPGQIKVEFLHVFFVIPTIAVAVAAEIHRKRDRKVDGLRNDIRNVSRCVY